MPPIEPVSDPPFQEPSSYLGCLMLMTLQLHRQTMLVVVFRRRGHQLRLTVISMMDQCLYLPKATSQASMRLKSMHRHMLKPTDTLLRQSDRSCGIRLKASVENTQLDATVHLNIKTARKDVLESVKSRQLRRIAYSLSIAYRMKMALTIFSIVVALSFGYIIIALYRILQSIINIAGFVD